MNRDVDIKSVLVMRVGETRTHAINWTPESQDGQTISAVVSVAEEDTAHLTIGTPAVLVATFTDASSSTHTAASGLGVKAQITASTRPCDGYLIWKITLSGGDTPVPLRQRFVVT